MGYRFASPGTRDARKTLERHDSLVSNRYADENAAKSQRRGERSGDSVRPVASPSAHADTEEGSLSQLPLDHLHTATPPLRRLWPSTASNIFV
jgi:hypothetical protein